MLIALCLMSLLSGKAASSSQSSTKFWSAEKWMSKLEGDRNGGDLADPMRRWHDTFVSAQKILEQGTATAAEEAYLSALTAYLSLDFPSAWESWKTLEAVPAYREEMRWLLWGPQAGQYRQKASDWRWRRSAQFFREGLQRFSAGEWEEATALFDQAVRQKQEHFLARRYYELSISRRARSEGARPERAVPPEVRNFRGSDEERLARGEKAFRNGSMSLALAWFHSLSEFGTVSEARAIGRRAVQRLGWMFPEK